MIMKEEFSPDDYERRKEEFSPDDYERRVLSR